MKAVVLDAPGPVEALQLREVPDPVPEPGWVLIEVRAAGLNRSELHTRLGMAEGMVFPRVLGLEAAGVVLECLGGEFEIGAQVVAMMGGMGRQFDGGYAESPCMPVRQVIPFTSSLPWSTLGAVPEMLQTAYGSLTVGLDIQRGQTLLIRGGHLQRRHDCGRAGEAGGTPSHRHHPRPVERRSPSRAGSRPRPQ